MSLFYADDSLSYYSIKCHLVYLLGKSTSNSFLSSGRDLYGFITVITIYYRGVRRILAWEGCQKFVSIPSGTHTWGGVVPLPPL